MMKIKVMLGLLMVVNIYIKELTHINVILPKDILYGHLVIITLRRHGIYI